METIYADIAKRTGGNIYIGVVGPVRTGKSTLIKRIMEQLVIPNITDPYRQERARDELPQSGSGKTIMTSEPKFIPEEAVEIAPDDTAKMRIRIIDSVGYMVDGAVGAATDGDHPLVRYPHPYDPGCRAWHKKSNAGALLHRAGGDHRRLCDRHPTAGLHPGGKAGH